MAGRIILVNGASSSGKSTLCRALQEKLEYPFWHFSIDHLRDAKVLPEKRINTGDFSWSAMRPAFFEGFHRCLPALALSGNNLLVEHIVETREWMSRLLNYLEPFDVYFVGLHCAVAELERREHERGNRRRGEARRDFEVVHTFGTYDLELDSMQDLEDNVNTCVTAWYSRQHPSAFESMLAADRSTGQNAP